MKSPIRSWRESNGFTQHQIASAMGQSDSNYSQKENNQTAWQVSDLNFFQREYGLSADFVLGFTGESADEEVAESAPVHV